VALAPPIELLNNDTEPIEPELVDFTRGGKVSPTGPERPLRTVCESSFETPTKDAANTLTTNLLQSTLNGCYVATRIHAHSIGVGSRALPSRHALPIERTEFILRDPRQDRFKRLAPAADPPCAAIPRPRSNARPLADPDFAVRLGIDGIVDILQAYFAAISGTFHIRGLRKHHEISRYSPDDIIDP
jgi:hypothetical protein